MSYKQKKFLQKTLDKIFWGNQTNHGISDKKKHLSFFAYIFDHYCQRLFVEGCMGYPAPSHRPPHPIPGPHKILTSLNLI